jgi:hypothetical protein
MIKRYMEGSVKCVFYCSVMEYLYRNCGATQNRAVHVAHVKASGRNRNRQNGMKTAATLCCPQLDPRQLTRTSLKVAFVRIFSRSSRFFRSVSATLFLLVFCNNVLHRAEVCEMKFADPSDLHVWQETCHCSAVSHF